MTPSLDPILITGLGAVTPAGVGVKESWATVNRGVSMAATDPRLVGLPVDFSCAVPGFDGKALLGRRVSSRVDIVTQYAMVAAREAVADAGHDPEDWDGARVAVIVGNSFGGCITYEKEHANFLSNGPGVVSPSLMVTAPVNMNAGYLSTDLHATGPGMVVSTACASGGTAIALARTFLDTNACDIAVAGGAECFLTPTTIASLANLGAMSSRSHDPAAASRPFDQARDGFVAGEGAGFVVLEREADAGARGARGHARLLGHGLTADGYHPSAPDPKGAGVRRAVASALAMAGLSGSDIAHVNAHGTSTPKNDELESEIIAAMYPGNPIVTSTKGAIGHLIGAAGAVEAIFTALAIEHGQVPPTANLETVDPKIEADVASGHTVHRDIPFAVSHSFGFGGQNAVLVLGAA